MVRKHGWIVVGVVALGMIVAAAASATAAGSGTKSPNAASFTLEDQNGAKVSLDDFKDKIVVLEWINWGCPFIVAHLRAGTEKALVEKFKDKGVVWLAINSTHFHNHETDKKGIAQYGLPYAVLSDRDGKVGLAYGAKTTPDIRIIQKGAVAYQGAIDNAPRGRVRGGGEKVNYVDKALTELLAGKSVSTAKTRPYGCSVKYAKK